MLFLDAARKDKIAKNTPLVYMKITGREIGIGTVRYPDHIFAEYRGNNYDFTCGKKYFYKTMAADSIAVHLDAASGEAVLPESGRVRHLAFLFAMMVGAGILVIWATVREYIKSKTSPETLYT
ncbi:MAG: hypothetical protein ACO1OF_04435 [Adhaeribacter sp.]